MTDQRRHDNAIGKQTSHLQPGAALIPHFFKPAFYKFLILS
jgi:hypothetical protein